MTECDGITECDRATGGDRRITENICHGILHNKGGKFGNALQAGSYGGKEAIVKLLLENGAEPQR